MCLTFHCIYYIILLSICQTNDLNDYHRNFRLRRTCVELRNLMTFIHVAELGSFTRTAEELGYSQSTISFQIKQLEDELGCLLFERINHTVTLTERGRELLPYAHEVRAMTDKIRENLTGREELSGHINVVTPDSICEDMISAHYMDFHRLYPSISIKFQTGDTGFMLDMMEHNLADVIITLDHRLYNKDYVIVKEERLPMHFVSSTKSKFAHARGISIKDIIGESFVLTEYGQGYRRVLDRELAKRSLEMTPVLELGRTDVITSILASSDMISFLPDFVTDELVRAGELCHLDVCDVNIDIWKQLIYHKNKWMSKSLQAFIDYVSEKEFSN